MPHLLRLLLPPLHALWCAACLFSAGATAAAPYDGELIDAWGAADLRQGPLTTVTRLLEQSGVSRLLLDFGGPRQGEGRDLFQEIGELAA